MTWRTHHTDIVVPSNRQRREFDEGQLQELITSIEENGLLHPIVCRTEGFGDEEHFVLVAGERRLRAIIELGEFDKSYYHNGEVYYPGDVPVTTLGQLSPLEAKEIELEENIRRSDLTWQERVEAEAELLKLREAKGTPREEIVAEIKGSSTPAAKVAVTQAVTLAKNMHRPEVAKAKSQADAWKALLRSEDQEKNARLAERLGKEHLSQNHTLIQGDCLEWLADAADAQFDVILSDPPYGMGADEFGDSGKAGKGAHFYCDDVASWATIIHCLVPHLSRVAKADAHAYLFCDLDNFGVLRSEMAASGWKVFRTPLIWYKPSAFRAPWPEKGPQRKYECILYAVRGELKTRVLAGDVITCPPDENLGHPAQKPVALFHDLLKRSVRPGMSVLDPFCGTGPVFEAAHALSAFATGIELDAAACGIAAGRLAKLKGEK